MVLEKLSKSLKGTLQKLARSGLVDKKQVEELSQDIKKSLISSDTNIELANQISDNIKNRALKEKPAQGLTVREHTVNIVYEELVNLLGKGQASLDLSKKPAIIMLVGLFGSGKTTTTAKLAKYFKKQNKKIAVMQTDTWRPAAYDQLEQLAGKLKIDFYGNKEEKNPVKIVKEFKDNFEKYDIVLVDTAGRDALNDELIGEIKDIKSELNPTESVLVISGDIGQTAEKQAQTFHESVGVNGVILTKLDGTAKGGGALSACTVTDAKVMFIGTGERLDNLEEFKPKNFVSILLGMGDLETLIKKAEGAISKEDAEKMGKKLKEGKFTLTDLQDQMGAMKKMGPMSQVMNLIPGMAGMNLPKDAMKEQEGKMDSWKFLMDSMTLAEKENPEIINASRIARIAKGSGRSESEVRDLLAQYKKMKKIMKLVKNPRQMKQLSKMFGGKMPPGMGI